MGRLPSPDLEVEQEFVLAAKDAVLLLVEISKATRYDWTKSPTITRLNRAIKDFEESRK